MSDWTGECSDTQTWQMSVDMHQSGTPDLLPQVTGGIRVLPGQRELSWPKHDVTEGSMTLGEDNRAAAILLIGLS